MFRLPTISQRDIDMDGSPDGEGEQSGTLRLDYIHTRVVANRVVYQKNNQQFRQSKRQQRLQQAADSGEPLPGDISGYIPLVRPDPGEVSARGSAVIGRGKKGQKTRKRRYWETWEPSTSSKAGAAFQPPRQPLPDRVVPVDPVGIRFQSASNLVTTTDDQ